MWILPLVGYAGVILGFCFLVLAIASGLYYLSELVEEHTVLSKKLLTRLIYTVIGAQLLLCVVDRFPFGLTLLSIGSHVVYMQNLRRFPVVKLTDPFLISSCVLVLLNHYLWFNHFQRPTHNSSAYTSYRNYNPYDPAPPQPSFTEIASYFGLCVWLIPFALFVGLSAGENVLPSMGSEYATGSGSNFVTPGREPGAFDGAGGGVGGKAAKGNSGMAKALVNGVREWVGETGESMGFWREEGRRRF